MTRKTPTPPATVMISIKSETASTCPANTCRSGSAIVVIRPSKKQTGTAKESLRSRVICFPTPSPIGIMAMSAPREKSPIPTIKSTAPTRKSISISAGMGTINALSTTTKREIGVTDLSASPIFPFNLFNAFSLPGTLPYTAALYFRQRCSFIKAQTLRRFEEEPQSDTHSITKKPRRKRGFAKNSIT